MCRPGVSRLPQGLVVPQIALAEKGGEVGKIMSPRGRVHLGFAGTAMMRNNYWVYRQWRSQARQARGLKGHS